jgi:hypothetical protein
MLVYTLQLAGDAPRHQLPQRMFVFDPAKGTPQPYTAVNVAAERAARIVGR